MSTVYTTQCISHTSQRRGGGLTCVFNMETATNIYQKYKEFLEFGDRRTSAWPLMSSPFPTLAILICYSILCAKAPAIMADKKPFQIRYVLITYNLGMVIYLIFLLREFSIGMTETGFSLGCQPVDYSPTGDRTAWAAYLFFISKLIELTDTVLIILRKKMNQLSFLHVFHHGFLPFNWWFGVKFVPGGFGVFHGLVNIVVHIVMYTYYGLAAFGPSVQKYLWWKKYITRIQITQFFIVVAHTSQIFFMKDCDYPPIYAYAILIYTLCFMVLFLDFYFKTYRKKPAKPYTNGVTSNGHIPCEGSKAD